MKNSTYFFMCISVFLLGETLSLNGKASEKFSRAKRRAQVIAGKKIDQPIETKSNNHKEDMMSKGSNAAAANSYAYLGQYLKPWEFGDADEKLEINLDNAELLNFIKFIEQRFNLVFIIDDVLKPLPQGGKSVVGTKISFATHEPLTKKQTWDIFTTFLDMAGLACVPETGIDRCYRIVSNNPTSPFSANKAPLPTFIGVDPSIVPDNDEKIRYIYFVENASLNVIKNVLDSMKSTTAANLVIFEELRAVMITDKAANIRAMLEVITELDKTNMPQMMSVLKLHRTDATKVRDLYMTLVKEEGGAAGRLLGARKNPTSSYFPETLRVIAEPRTNSLFLIGNKEEIKKVENFIRREIDKEIDVPFSPLHIWPLKYVDAETVATLVREATQFQQGSEAATYGGVRDNDKYFKPISVTAEKMGNRLIINADYEDYIKIAEMLEKIDVEQPQVAIKVLLLNVDLTDTRELGGQIRNRDATNAIPPVTFQTSGLVGAPNNYIQENVTGPGALRLLGNLVNLATGNDPGSTLMTLGSDMFGVWGILKVLQTYARVGIIANPFLVTTHKYQATVLLGEVRRVTSATVFGESATEQAITDLDASLKVTITPQVSPDGFITLDVFVKQEQFNSTSLSNNNRTNKEVTTSVIVANKEVIALGGLVVDTVQETETKVPILGDIPILGFLFKNKLKIIDKTTLVILISAEVIPPSDNGPADCFTGVKLGEARDTLLQMHSQSEIRDPIHRWFFNDNYDRSEGTIDAFVAQRDKYIDPAVALAIEEEKKHKSAGPGVHRHSYLGLHAGEETPKDDAQDIGTSSSSSRRKNILADLVEGSNPAGSSTSEDTTEKESA
jgi:general secretion pathway protein D